MSYLYIERRIPRVEGLETRGLAKVQRTYPCSPNRFQEVILTRVYLLNYGA